MVNIKTPFDPITDAHKTEKPKCARVLSTFADF